MGYVYWMKKRLHEVAIGVQQAQAQGLALKAVGSVMVLYDPKGLLAGLQSDEQDADELSSSIYGFLEVKQPGGKDKCWNAYMVRTVAAQNGYGPLMYDMAMQVYGRIMPDRNQVTPAAAAIWKYYIEKRGDVEKFKFDDVTAPETPDTQDDCTLHYDNPELNYAIGGGGQDVSGLRKNHEEFIRAGGPTADHLLDSAADAFFRRMY